MSVHDDVHDDEVIDQVTCKGWNAIRKFYEMVFQSKKNRPPIRIISHWDDVKNFRDYNGIYIFVNGESWFDEKQFQPLEKKIIYIGSLSCLTSKLLRR